jgi:hypothetical protein
MLNRASPIFGLAHYNPVRLLFERSSQLGADHRVIVHQKNTDHATP